MPGGKCPAGHVQSLEPKQTRSEKDPYKASAASVPLGEKGAGPGAQDLGTRGDFWKVTGRWRQVFFQVWPSGWPDALHWARGDWGARNRASGSHPSPCYQDPFRRRVPGRGMRARPGSGGARRPGGAPPSSGAPGAPRGGEARLAWGREAVRVSWGCCRKCPQAGWLQTGYVFPHSYGGLDVQDQGGTWDMLPPMAPGKSPSWLCQLLVAPVSPWCAAASVFAWPARPLPNTRHWM